MATGYRLTASTGIHKGDREYQQDQIALLKHSRINGCILAIVADGMGGRSGGRKASDQVMMTAKQLFERYDPETDDAAAILSQIVQEAHIVIKLTAISSEEEPHSTMAAFLINAKGDCHWAHTGDSVSTITTATASSNAPWTILTCRHWSIGARLPRNRPPSTPSPTF